MAVANVTAVALVIIGALNWGLVGIADFDLVAALLGEGSAWSRAIYILVGVAGVYCVLALSAVRVA